MKKHILKLIGTAVLMGTLCMTPATAQEKMMAKEKTKPIPAPVIFTTEKSGRFNGERVDYKTVAGDTFVRDGEGEPIARFFSYAYIKDDDASERPVTFIFNGGPGSASMWLHMGVFGPRRVVIPSDPADDGAAPYNIIDNPETLLDVTDLVFIDPIGTGLSRVVGKEDPKKHWGVLEDGKSVAEFIRTWIDDNNRWNSPKFIAGESYGTVRTAVLADELTNNHNIALNGVILISAVLDYQNSRFQDGSIMSYVSFLPTYAATAWYHNKLPNKPANLEVFLQEVRDFARGEYATALIAGERLSDAEKTALVDKLHNYTGLKKSWLKAANMRVHVFRFFKELLRDEGKVVGRIDSRYLGEEPDSAGEFYEADPYIYGASNAFTVAINDHLKNFLNTDVKDRKYNISARADSRFNWNWNVWGKNVPNGGRYVNVIPALGRAMRRNSDMQVMLMSGYYDFATPFFGAENALAEVDIVQDRVRYTYYEAGHMMYVHEPSRLQFMKDMRSFITDSLK